jgi:hypothetical protein
MREKKKNLEKKKKEAGRDEDEGCRDGQKKEEAKV